MDIEKEVSKWSTYFKDRGLPTQIIESHCDYIRKLASNNAPAIFEIEHLSKLLGIEREHLNSMINASSSFYRTFKIPKRRGDFRTIKAPYPSLLQCQSWIYKNILLNNNAHKCAHGFNPGKSIFSNAKNHLAAKAILRIDLENFFPSIPINWVINFFSRLGYNNSVSFYLASLCCCDGALVQGAPTSPYLTNLLLTHLDERLLRLSKKYNLKYSRYADDLTFSGSYIPHDFINIVTEIIDSAHLKVNQAKTRLKIGDGQKIVTGLSVGGAEIRLPRKTKRQLKKEIFYIRKFGLFSHLSKTRAKNPNYLDSLLGRIAFWIQAEPKSKEASESFEHIKKLRAELEY